MTDRLASTVGSSSTSMLLVRSARNPWVTNLAVPTYPQKRSMSTRIPIVRVCAPSTTMSLQVTPLAYPYILPQSVPTNTISCFHLNNLNMLPITTAYDLLVAQPSFDVWSLGCILYQMCSPDVRPLFQGTAYLTLTP